MTKTGKKFLNKHPVTDNSIMKSAKSMNPSPKYCGKCGISLEPGARFCGECGAAIDEFQECDQKSTSKNRIPDPPPRTSTSPNDTDSSSGQLRKKGMAWIQAVPVWWGLLIGLLLIVILVLLGGGIASLSILLVLFIALLIGKVIVSTLGKKR